MLRIAGWTLIALVLLAGCDQKVEPVAPPKVVTGTGVVRGKVTFIGTPPVMKSIANRPCHEGAPPLVEETVVLGEGGGLENVVVMIKGMENIDVSSMPPAMLDQVHCRYVPHVLAVGVNRPLVVRSSDDTVHNVHVLAGENRSENFGQTRAGEQRELRFSKPETMRVKCDVHPWMSAYVVVVDHPFVSVTRDGGKFEITGLPAGSYTLSAWHELYGTLESPLVIDGPTPVEVNLKYQAP